MNDKEQKETTNDIEQQEQIQEIEQEQNIQPPQEQEQKYIIEPEPEPEPKENVFEKIHEFRENKKQQEEIQYSIEEEKPEKVKTPKIKPAKLSTDIDIQEEEEEEESEEIEEDDTPRGGSPTSSAKAFVMALNVVNSRICGYIGKKPHSRYTLTPAEKKEVLELTIEYFEEQNISMSPLFVFIFVISVTIGGKVGQAIEDRKEEKEKEIKKATEEARAKRIKAQGVEEVKRQILEDGKQERFVEKFNDRSKFAFYPTGKYKNVYVYASTGNGKRYALKQNEHLKDENHEVSDYVRKCYDKLKNHYSEDKELFKILGVLMRKIQQQAEENLK